MSDYLLIDLVIVATLVGFALICWWYTWAHKRLLAEDERKRAAIYDDHYRKLDEIYAKHDGTAWSLTL